MRLIGSTRWFSRNSCRAFFRGGHEPRRAILAGFQERRVLLDPSSCLLQGGKKLNRIGAKPGVDILADHVGDPGIGCDDGNLQKPARPAGGAIDGRREFNLGFAGRKTLALAELVNRVTHGGVEIGMAMYLFLHLDHFRIRGMSPPFGQQTVWLPRGFERHRLALSQMSNLMHIT